MSDNQATALDVSEYQAFVTGSQAVAASLALYLFDWLITLDLEINHMWLPRWTRSTWVFMTGRYVTFFTMMLELLPTLNKMSCIWEIRLEQACSLLQLLAVALFTGLRTYALAGQRTWVFCVVFGLAAVPVVVNIASFAKEPIVFTEAPLNNICQTVLALSEPWVLRLSLISRIPVIAADIIALTAAWRKAVGVVRDASRCNIRVPLSDVLIRDGSVLFLCQLLLNIYTLMMDDIPSFAVLANGPTFVTSLSTILMCRFMLHLKRAGGPNSEMDSFSNVTAPWSTISFGRSNDRRLSYAGESEEVLAACSGDTSHMPVASMAGQDVERASGAQAS